MTGLELSKAYYTEIGLPMLEQHFPDLLPRMAAGLVGEGSECFGFDDAISTDHDFGPAFCLWLAEEDYTAYGKKLQKAYDHLYETLRESVPGGGQVQFHGCPLRTESARGGGRTGVHEITAFYARYLGRRSLPSSNMDWLRIPEENLALMTNGEVFRDPSGSFSEWRRHLQAYYPEDVRIKKIAARAAEMARTGQYNYARCMRRGEYVAAELAAAGFLRSAMSMIYLLNRQYAPYYKWMHRGLRELSARTNDTCALAAAIPRLEETAAAGLQQTAWSDRADPGRNAFINTEDKKVRLIEEICRMTVEELNRQGLSSSGEVFLEAQTWEIMKRIRDPELRKLHVLIG